MKIQFHNLIKIPCLIFFLQFSAVSQISSKKLAVANERAENGARTISQLIDSELTNVPIAYMQKAKAIAVIPEMKKVNFFLGEVTIGYGLVCKRTNTGWSAPAFLTLKGVGLSYKVFENAKFDTIILFMTEDSMDWLMKGDIKFNKKKNMVLGPIIKAELMNKDIINADILYYPFIAGKPLDKNLTTDYFAGFTLFHDNKMTKSIYKMKVRELLETDDAPKMPISLAKFRISIENTQLKNVRPIKAKPQMRNQ